MILTDKIPSRLVIATRNRGKVAELERLLAPLPFPLEDLSAYPGLAEPDETGETFAENAAIKAKAYAAGTREWVLADDSGLEVDALGGEPGVHSARFAGRTSGYDEKMKIILGKLAGVDGSARAARFVCVIALADPSGRIAFEARGECPGTIAPETRGSNGFGYDPIFVPDGFVRTFGEMSDEEKRALSHRGKASQEFIRKMLDFIGL